VTKIVLLLVLVLIGAAVAFVLTWDIPPPAAQVETVIPNDRFPR